MMENLKKRWRLWNLTADLSNIEDTIAIILLDEKYSRTYRWLLGEERWTMWVCNVFTRAEDMRFKILELGGTVKETHNCPICGSVILEY